MENNEIKNEKSIKNVKPVIKKDVEEAVIKKPVVKKENVGAIKKNTKPIPKSNTKKENINTHEINLSNRTRILLSSILGALLLISIFTGSMFIVNKNQIDYYETQRQIEMRTFNKFLKIQTYLENYNSKLALKHDEIFDMLKLIYTYSDMYDVDPYLSLAVAVQESGYFELDNDKTIGTSGEIGYFQIMPPTAKLFGYNESDLKDIDKNVRLGIYYISLQLEFTDDNVLNALRCYNGGRGYAKNDITLTYAEAVMEKKELFYEYISNLE
jgi:hypothetical protein